MCNTHCSNLAYIGKYHSQWRFFILKEKMIEAFENYLSLEKKYSSHTVTAYLADVQEFAAYLLEVEPTMLLPQVDYPLSREWNYQ